MPRVKQVILIRKDLKMRRGKEIAQGSHAAAAFMTTSLDIGTQGPQSVTLTLTSEQVAWLDSGMAKVCLRVNSEAELLEYHQRATDAGLQSHLIIDSGRTEFAGVATPTACAIGPHDVDKIDSITSSLIPY